MSDCVAVYLEADLGLQNESDLSLPPRPKGQLVALRTKAEVEASFSITDAYVTKIPTQSANSVLVCVIRHSTMEGTNGGSQHCR